MTSLFNKDKLKQLADSAKAAGSRLGTQLQAGIQSAQQQAPRRAPSAQDNRGEPRTRPTTVYEQSCKLLHCLRAACDTTPIAHRAAGASEGGHMLPPPPLPSSSVQRAGSSLSSLSPDEAIHLLQSQVGGGKTRIQSRAAASTAAARPGRLPLSAACRRATASPCVPSPAEQGAP